MSATYLEATREMTTLFKDVWEPLGYTIYWQKVAGDKVTTANPFAQYFTQHVDTGRVTLSGGTGSAFYRRFGFLTIMVFHPQGQGMAYGLAQKAANVYEGKSTANVWFRNVRVNEVNSDGAFSQVNIIVDFEYDEVK